MKGIGVHRGSGGVKNIRNKCKSLTSDKNPWFKNGYCGKKKTNLILRTNVSIDIVKTAKRLAGNRCCARPKN